ncbi:MAG: isoprenylcysteine carboxylmethyltransferase family protein [Dehalococcoidia bacterium]|nr:isoprenylcysteine carboxylmethyltransferase family protein [Dehalococcoidia bacterium]
MEYDYGLWPIVMVNVAVFIVFSLGFLKPKTKHDWHSFGVLSAFVLALFTEMYGFPLTIYLVSALLGRFPNEQTFSHMSGNIWASLFLSPESGAVFMLLGGVLIAAGAWLVSVSWKRIHAAQGGLVTQGPYAVIRHPQYAGLVVAVIGALVQWPTLITMLMAPVLVAMYWRLAKREERNLEKQFGDGYRAYRERIPAFLPSPSSSSRREQES